MHVVKNLLKPTCSFWAWGDVRPIAKPKCRHGFPCVIRKVKKETINKDRLFFCCAQEDSCKYFEWVLEEPYYDAKYSQPDIKQDEKREEQYPTNKCINDLATVLKIWTSIYSDLNILFEQF